MNDVRQIGFIMPANGEITSRFEKRVNPVTNEEEFHNGIDIAVVEGTPVLAIYDATVKETGEDPYNGKFIRLETDHGYSFVFAHLSEITVKKGKAVKQGETVAKSGNTGISTGPHVHFTLRLNGELINPLSEKSMSLSLSNPPK